MSVSFDDLPAFVRTFMPKVAVLHTGVQPTESLTAYQIAMRSRFLMQSWWHVPQADQLNIAMMQHRLFQWLSFGMPIFRLSQDLFSALLLTDPANVEPSCIKLPFPTFALILPENNWTTPDPTGNPQTIKVGFVHRFQTLSLSDSRRAMLDSEALTRPHETMLRFCLHSQQIEISDQHQDVEPGPLSVWLTDPHTGWRESTSFSVPDAPDDKHIRFGFRRLFVNLCLYLSEHGMGAQDVATKKRSFTRAQKATASFPSANVWFVGRDVRIHPSLIQASRNWVTACAGDRAAWKINKRFVVRGHWRNQVCGPQRSLRERRWIEPFWKGPKEGERLQHIYVPERKDG